MTRTKWPKYQRGMETCFNCGRRLDQRTIHASQNAPGHGQMRGECTTKPGWQREDCGMITFFDYEEEVTK